MKSYLIQKQYQLAHLFRILGSIIFGFIYISLWTGVLAGKEQLSIYQVEDMVHYMTFSQSLIWILIFLTPGLGIPQTVRNGTIGIELARPVSFYWIKISSECGKLIYQLIFRSFPLAIVFFCTAGFYFPAHWTTYLWTMCSVLLGILISMNISYLIGLIACWIIEVKGILLLYSTVVLGLSGQFVPLDLFPAGLAEVVRFLPFACIMYYPVLIFLEKASVGLLGLQFVWATLLTLFSLWMTRIARRHVEIQGG